MEVFLDLIKVEQVSKEYRTLEQLSHSPLPEMVRGFIIPVFVNDYATHWF
jgi:hypothetical protein